MHPAPDAPHPAPRDRVHDTPAAWVDRAAAPCIHLALLLQRTPAGDPAAADITLQAATAALARLHPSDETRDLGLPPHHLTAIRLALAAFLDESAAHQPGAERWREQLFQRLELPRSANVGHEFFDRLGPLLAAPSPDPADLAVLQVHALCLLLGFRGRYGAHVDAAEADVQHLLRRLQLRLRPCLAPRPAPPFGHVPRDMPHEPASRPLQLALLLIIAALALTAALHTRLGDHQETLRAHLGTLAASP
jgi:type IV/VI secretion system ImpK/VasF family protein